MPTDNQLLEKLLRETQLQNEYMKRLGSSNFAVSKQLLRLAKALEVDQPPLEFTRRRWPEIT